jgi:hypothetical protein
VKALSGSSSRVAISVAGLQPSENSGVIERPLPEITCERFAPDKQRISLLARLLNASNLRANSPCTEEAKETFYTTRHSCHDMPEHFGSANMPSGLRLHAHRSSHSFRYNPAADQTAPATQVTAYYTQPPRSVARSSLLSEKICSFSAVVRCSVMFGSSDPSP